MAASVRVFSRLLNNSHRVKFRFGFPVRQKPRRELTVHSNSANGSYFYSIGSKVNDFSSPHSVKITGMIFAGVLGFLGLEKDEAEKEAELITLIKRAILLIQRGQLNQAEQMLHLALKTAQQTQDQDGITYVYDLLANLALEKGDLAKAEKLFVAVMQRLLTSGAKQDDNRLIHASLKLAQMHSEIGKDKGGNPIKAEEGFQFCLNGLQNKIKSGGEGENDEDTILLLALTEEAYARFLMSQNRLGETQNYLEKALKHLEKGISLGHRGPDEELRTALLLNDLGSICSLRGDQEAAVLHLDKAIESGERGIKMRKETKNSDEITKSIGDEELVASLRVNLGVVYAKKGMLEQAQTQCQTGWKIAKKLDNKEVLNEANDCLDEVKKLLNK